MPPSLLVNSCLVLLTQQHTVHGGICNDIVFVIYYNLLRMLLSKNYLRCNKRRRLLRYESQNVNAYDIKLSMEAPYLNMIAIRPLCI